MWQIALKAPSGVKYQTWNQLTSQWQIGSDINDWIKAQFTTGDKPWTKWIMFNDEPPTDDVEDPNADPEGNAHAKGIVVWNDTQLGFLLHSVPKFAMRDMTRPDTFSPGRIPDAETIYGQSFCWLLLPIDQLEVLFTHLHLDDPLVYDRQDPDHQWAKRGRLPPGSDLITHVSDFYKNETVTIDLISKSAKWNRCLFADFLASQYGPCYVDSWGRPLSANTADVVAAQELTWTDGTTYHEQQDHSKWACSSNGLPWCGIFDGNFQQSQKKRGFGGVVIHCQSLANAFKTMVTSTTRPLTPTRKRKAEDQLHPV